MKAMRLGCMVGVVMLAAGGVAEAQQVIKVGYPPSGPPLFSIDPQTQKPTGAAIELATAVAKDTGFEIEFYPVRAPDMLAALSAKTIDVALDSVPSTRQGQVDLSEPIWRTTDGVLVKKGRKEVQQRLEDFRGIEVGAVANTPCADILNASGLFSDVKLYATNPDLYQAVNNGEIKAAFSDAIVVIDLLHSGRWPDLQTVSDYRAQEIITGVFAYPKGEPDLAKKINDSLKKLKADGTARSIFAKYGILFALAN